MDLEPAWAGPARVRVQHPCPFCEFSGDHLDVAMAQWCNRHSEGLQISVWSR